MAATFRDLFSLTLALTFVIILLFSIVNFYPTSKVVHLTVNTSEPQSEYLRDIDGVSPVTLSELLNCLQRHAENRKSNVHCFDT